VIVEMMPPERTAWVARILNVCAFLTCAVATWISLDENIRQVVQDVHLMKVRPIPQIYISAWITYGIGSSAIYFLRMACGRSAGRVQTSAEARL
jgi:TRAP-type C4-dicarboxylate transport system permease small subunit